MKKWPQEWVEVISKHLNGAVEYGRAEGSKITTGRQSQTINWRPILEDMDRVGMLKEIQEPFEFDWCVPHESRRLINEKCKRRDGEPYLTGCYFVKMREVIELDEEDRPMECPF